MHLLVTLSPSFPLVLLTEGENCNCMKEFAEICRRGPETPRDENVSPVSYRKWQQRRICSLYLIPSSSVPTGRAGQICGLIHTRTPLRTDWQTKPGMPFIYQVLKYFTLQCISSLNSLLIKSLSHLPTC